MPLGVLLPKPTNPFASSILLAYGFIGLILLGMILLILPVSSASGQVTSFINALFTSASAACVTGLVVVDTGTYWSTFGQGVIFALFQIGGFGFIVMATLLLMAIGGKFSLRDRLIVSESMGVEHLGGILGLIARVAVFVLVIEAVGALVVFLRWSAVDAPGVTLWTAVFHSASAFNNCGMDLLGSYKSLVDYQGDAILLLTTATLCIVGSTGYAVLSDWFRKWRWVKLSLDSKIVLLITFLILVIGTIFIFITEFHGARTLGPMPLPQKILVAFFQAVVPRTAGFSAIDINGLQSVTLFFIMFLMFIGGASGSAAGGIKLNTAGILGIAFINMVRGRENISAFGRQITKQSVFRAMALVIFYLCLVCLIVLGLAATENFPMDKLLFETFSAMGTVGLSTGITPDLTVSGKFIITIAMFLGRLAPLAFIAYLVHNKQQTELEYPHENVRMG